MSSSNTEQPTQGTTESSSWCGRVKWFNNKAGYGFITASDGDRAGEDVFVQLLRGWAPLVEAFCEETGALRPPSGAFLLRSTLPWGQETISVWVGARITLMIDTNEQNILRHKLGLPWRDEEE